MNQKLRFCDAFWSTDLLSSAGYEVLKKKVREGRITGKAFEDYLRSRAKSEEEYAKAIQRATKSLQDTLEIGTLRLAFDSLQSETEKMAADHLETGVQFNDAAARLNDFMERQKNERKPKEIAVDKMSVEKGRLFRKHQDMKKLYESKSQEAEQADFTLKKAKPNENTFATRDWDKIIKKQQTTASDAHKAKQIYQDSVDRLNQARIQWERDMTEFCQMCEMLEEARVKMLQNEIWLKCNIVSVSCVQDDLHYEMVRDVLERVDSDEDIRQFIQRAATGSEKPLPIKFEEFECGSSSQQNIVSSMGASSHPSEPIRAARHPVSTPPVPSGPSRPAQPPNFGGQVPQSQFYNNS